MTLNSSLSVTVFLHPLFSSNTSLRSILMCYEYSSGRVVFPVYTFTNVLIFYPLHVLVFYVGVKQRSNQRSALGATRWSHNDLFTFHTILMEGLGVWALVLFSYGICVESEKVISISIFMFCMFFPGLTFLDCLTCVERYLAVVHPMIYRRQQERGASRIRNVSIAFVWLQCLVCVGVEALYQPYFPTVPFLCLLGFSILTISYCSFSILCILIGPGPGEAGRSREGFDQTRQRAFHLTIIILGALLLRFLGLFLCFGLVNLVTISENVCVLMNSGIWLALPSSLVLPLLFLQRAGRLPCCRQSPEPE